MPPNHCYSSTAADSRCLYPVKWQRVPQRSAGSVSCSSLNIHKGSSVEPERFTDGRPPDVGSSAEQIKAKRSLCLLTGWIEMLQILKSHWSLWVTKLGEEKNWLPEVHSSSASATTKIVFLPQFLWRTFLANDCVLSWVRFGRQFWQECLTAVTGIWRRRLKDDWSLN